MTEQETDFEAKAREQGWKPETEWEGDPPKSGFKSAEQFVKDGERITPILKSQVERLESRVDELLTSNKQLHEFTQRSLSKEKKEKDKLIAELEGVRKNAVTEGDGDAFEKADRQLNELRSEDLQPEQRVDPLAEKWVQDNSWYAQNDKLGAFADGIAERLVRQGYTGQAYFDELTRRTKEAFPDEFENPNRKKHNVVESDTTKSVTDSKAKTFDNLPDDAKAQYRIFKRDIPGFTKEAYVENYDWD